MRHAAPCAGGRAYLRSFNFQSNKHREEVQFRTRQFDYERERARSPDIKAAPNLLDASAILIPAAPSKIDIRATVNLIKELLLAGGFRQRNLRAAVIANRARPPSRICSTPRSMSNLETPATVF